MTRTYAAAVLACLVSLMAGGSGRLTAAPQGRDGRPTVATAGQLIISEFRLRGPDSTHPELDEFIEIYNASGSAHTVAAASGTGYGIAASDGVTRCTIPNGTVIPDHGHYLCVNSVGYSLVSYPAGSGIATGDATYTTDIPDNAGIAIFNNNSGGGSYSLGNRLDAVGSTSEANTLYKEGAGYPAVTPFSIEHAFTRRPFGGCIGSDFPPSGNCLGALAMAKTGPVTTSALVDTDNNAGDFMFVDTVGTSAGAGQRLGAPGPENMSSPISRDGSFTVTNAPLDSCAVLGTPPNAVRDNTSDPPNNSKFGTFDLRRTFTNATGVSLTRLRFRIVDLSTYPAVSGVAELRPRTSSAVVVTVDRPPCGAGTSNVTVQGTTLEQPPTQKFGGGYNSTLSASTVTLATPLASGASIDVHFLLGIEQTGNARFCVIPETLPGAAVQPFCYIGSTETSDTYTPHVSDVPLYNRATGAWTLLLASSSYASTSTVNWGGPGYVPVTGDFDGDGRADVALYQPTTGSWLIRTSSSNFTSAFTVNWGGAGYVPVPGDYDGDGKTDPALYQPTTGLWLILKSSTSYASSVTISWGGPGYTPIGGLDFDNDKTSDLTIYNEGLGRWYVLQSHKSPTPFAVGFTVDWGGPGYTLVPGDYDGDGRTDFGLYQRATGLWSILKSSTSYTSSQTVSWGGPGFVPVPGDYDTDGRMDLGLYQLQTDKFLSLLSSSAYSLGGAIVQTFGTLADVPNTSAVLPRSSREIDEGDVDGDFTSDLTVYNTTSGIWSILKSSTGFTTATNIGWGGTGYTPVPGDYDGDGKGDLGVYQASSGTWIVLLSSSNFTTTLTKSNGGAGYVPVAGDFDGDGKTDIVTYNTATGLWFGLESSTNYTTTVNVGWGGTGYTATPGDFDGDGRQDLALYQQSSGTWAILTSSSNYTASIVRSFGGAGFTPVPADFDGDGITDFAVYQTSTGIWSILRSSAGNASGFSVSYGGAGYTPVAGDWDGDGRADVGVYNTTSGQWSILLSNGNYTTSLSRNWGGAGYAPVPTFP